MSTKTVTKRIALATVVALGAGVLSLVSVTSANAVAAVYNVAPTIGASNPAASADGLNIASNVSATGKIADGSNTSIAAATSVGLLSVSDIAGTRTAGTTQTATLLSSGTLQVYTSATNGSLIVVTGGSIVQSNASQSNAGYTSGAVTGDAPTGADLASNIFWSEIKPASGVTSMTVALYAGTGTTSTTSAANLISGAASGTLDGLITVTIATASVSGAFSAANSGTYYEYATSYSTAGAYAGGLTADVTTGGDGTQAWNQKQHANIRLADAYGVALSAGLLTASATGGAYVALSAAGADGTPSAATAYYTSAPDNVILTVTNPTTAAVSTVVTIAYNGTTVATKTFTFTGVVAKIALSGAVTGKLSNSTSNTASIQFLDAAGNTVYTTGTASYPSSGFIADSNSYNGIVSATSLSTAPSTSSTPGLITFTCGATAGTANLDVKYTNLDGSVVTSNATPVTCSGAAVSYTVAYDKSTYNLGDIATLIITFKDSKGNLANDVDPVATTVATYTGSGLGTVVTAPAAKDGTSNGVIKYKWPVGNSAMSTGTYTNSIDFPTVDAASAAIGGSQAAQTASFTINSSGTSLNDVLKGIVSLIASINKQIAALAKLVTKK